MVKRSGVWWWLQRLWDSFGGDSGGGLTQTAALGGATSEGQTNKFFSFSFWSLVVAGPPLRAMGWLQPPHGQMVALGGGPATPGAI